MDTPFNFSIELLVPNLEVGEFFLTENFRIEIIAVLFLFPGTAVVERRYLPDDAIVAVLRLLHGFLLSESLVVKEQKTSPDEGKVSVFFEIKKTTFIFPVIGLELAPL